MRSAITTGNMLLSRGPVRALDVAIALLLAGALGYLVAEEGLLGPLLAVGICAPLLLAGFFARITTACLAVTLFYALSETAKRVTFISSFDQPLLQYLPLLLYQTTVAVLGLRAVVERWRNRQYDTIDKYYAGYLLLFILSTFVSEQISIPLGFITVLYFVPPMLMFFAYREAFREKRFSVEFLNLVVGIGVCGALYGMYQYFVGPSSLDIAWARVSRDISIQASNVWQAVTEGQRLRPYSLFADHFSYGYFCVAALIALGLIPMNNAKTLRFMLWSILIAGFAVAFTRGAWLSYLFAIGFCFVCWIFGKRRRLILYLVFPLYVLMTFVPGWLYERYFGEEISSNPEVTAAVSFGTLDVRMEAPSVAIEVLKHNPITGSGPIGGIGLILAKTGKGLGAFEQFVNPDAHNFLIGIALSAGGVGLLFYLIFFMRCLSSALSRASSRGVWLFSALSGVLMAGVASGPTIGSALLSAWLALAAATGDRREGDRLTPKSPGAQELPATI